MQNLKVVYEWGLYDVVRDDHFNTDATPKEIAEAMSDPYVSLRLVRWSTDESGLADMEDCHVRSDGTFEGGGYFLQTGRKVPKRYSEQLARWVAKYGYNISNCHPVS